MQIIKKKKKNLLKLNSICFIWAFKQKRGVNQISAVTSGSAMIIHAWVNPYKESQRKMWFKVLGLLFRDSEFPPSTPNKVHEPMSAPLSHHRNQCKSSVTQTLNLISEIQRDSKFPLMSKLILYCTVSIYLTGLHLIQDLRLIFFYHTVPTWMISIILPMRNPAEGCNHLQW